MKNKYEEPKIEIVLLDEQDLVTTLSGPDFGVGKDEDFGELFK